MPIHGAARTEGGPARVSGIGARPRPFAGIRAPSIWRLSSTTLVWLGALACLGPLAWALVASLSVEVGSLYAPGAGSVHMPTIDNYVRALRDDRLWTGFKNTGIELLIVLPTTLFFCPLAGYAFAKFQFPAKRVLLVLMIPTLFSVPVTQYIPLLVEMNMIGWVGTYQALVTPLLISSLGIFWMMAAIRAVPDELLHAARVDGCNSFLTWWHVVMPAIRPSLVSLAFVTFITAYNDYFWPLLILPQDSMQTVQIVLQAGSGYGQGFLAEMVIVSLPAVAVFLVMQQYFLQRLMLDRRPLIVAEADAPFPPGTEPIEAESGNTAEPAATTADASTTPPLAVRGSRLSQHLVSVVHCGAIVAGTALVYVHSLRNSLHLEDALRVSGNPAVEHLAPLWRYFSDPAAGSSVPVDLQFRPLLPLSLAINHLLTADSVAGYHLGNQLLLACAGVITYFLARELLGGWVAPALDTAHAGVLAMAVALLACVHPVSALLVDYVSGRALLLMQIFLGASLLLYMRLRRTSADRLRRYGSKQRRQWELSLKGAAPSALTWLAILALFELAMLAKTQAIVAPGLIVAFELTAGRESLTRVGLYLRALPFVAVAWAHLASINSYVGYTALPDSANTGFDATWNYPLTQTRLSVVHYLGNFAWPFNIRQVAVQPTASSLFDGGVLLGLAFIVATLLYARHVRRTQPVLAFCILAYWIAQSPESSVVPMMHNAADYRPYPAAPFLFLTIALLLRRYLRPALASTLLIALVLYFSIASIGLSATW